MCYGDVDDGSGGDELLGEVFDREPLLLPAIIGVKAVVVEEHYYGKISSNRPSRPTHGSLYIFITILFFINEDLRMSLFCSPAVIFYYWTREFNQAIVSLSGQVVQYTC
jgi:hypothetical protein